MPRSNDSADELAEVAFTALKFTVTFLLLVTGAVAGWAISLLSRSFRLYYPHKSLLAWLALSLTAIACAVVVVALTHSVLAWTTLIGLIAAALVSLAVLERVLANLAAQAAPPTELPFPSPWSDEL